jgi:pyruvate dehydrogenase E2 component (dihydrolipoamide acetyltransferase)
MSTLDAGAAHVVDITMPRLSDSMEEATVLQWLKRPGDGVRKGEPLVEVETDKATIVYEAELVGELEEIVVGDGETAVLGAVIARVRVSGSAPVARPVASAPEPDAAAPAASATPMPTPARSERHRATPVARRLAAELGVALAGLLGTGPGGRIVGGDVRAAARDGASAGPAIGSSVGRGTEAQQPMTATARTIARRMSESRSQIPDFTLELEIDMEPAARMRGELAADGTRSSFNDFVVRAVGLCLHEFPALNASYVDGAVVRFSRINVGIAVATEDALLVPTIFDADRKTIGEIAAESRAVAKRVRANAIELADLADGTFTVSNLGMFGIRRFQAVINAPQAAILAVGEVAPRPAVGTDGGLVVRRTMEVALSCDHRVVYGAEAARFLKRFRDLLEHPEQLQT